MKILIAVDESSDAVIREMAQRPWPAGSQFQVATVVDPYFFSHAPQVMQEAQLAAQESLDELVKPLMDAGWSVKENLLLDNPRHALSRAASEWQADLIVIGSHELGAVRRLLLGSTAQAVLRNAQCSVEIVRSAREGARQDGRMRVLIATDGSQHAEAAVASIARRPWPAGSKFKVIASPEYPVLIGEYPYYAPEQVADLTQQSLQHAKQAVGKAVEQLTQAGLDVSSEVMEPQDTPSHSILSAAKDWQADLIVLGSHGRRGFDRLILGSVSETVAMHATCSVELVRMPVPLL